MWKQSVWSSVIAASIATQYLKEGGFLSLTGAKAALGETAGLLLNDNIYVYSISYISFFTFTKNQFYLTRYDWLWYSKSSSSSVDKISSS